MLDIPALDKVPDKPDRRRTQVHEGTLIIARTGRADLIDSVERGRGRFEGKLKSGGHTLRVVADGCVPIKPRSSSPTPAPHESTSAREVAAVFVVGPTESHENFELGASAGTGVKFHGDNPWSRRSARIRAADRPPRESRLFAEYGSISTSGALRLQHAGRCRRRRRLRRAAAVHELLVPDAPACSYTCTCSRSVSSIRTSASHRIRFGFATGPVHRGQRQTDVSDVLPSIVVGVRAGSTIIRDRFRGCRSAPTSKHGHGDRRRASDEFKNHNGGNGDAFVTRRRRAQHVAILIGARCRLRPALAGCFGEGPIPTDPSEATILSASRWLAGARVQRGGELHQQRRDRPLDEGYLAVLPFSPSEQTAGAHPGIRSTSSDSESDRMPRCWLGGHVQVVCIRRASLRLVDAVWMFSMTRRGELAPSLGSVPSTGSSLQPTGIVADATSIYVAVSPFSGMNGGAGTRSTIRRTVLRTQQEPDAPRLPALEATVGGGSLTQWRSPPIYACENHGRVPGRKPDSLFYVKHSTTPRVADRQLSQKPERRRRQVTLGSVGGPDNVCRSGWQPTISFAAWTVSNRSSPGRRPATDPVCIVTAYDLRPRRDPAADDVGILVHARGGRCGPRLLHDREPADRQHMHGEASAGSDRDHSRESGTRIQGPSSGPPVFVAGEMMSSSIHSCSPRSTRRARRQARLHA